MRTLLLIVAIAALPRPALADPKLESKQHFEAATKAHKDGRFGDALTELMVAYALDPRPELIYAIAQIHVKLGQCPQAITFYERFLATNPKPEHAARAHQAIEVCKTNPPPPEAQQADTTNSREDLGLAATENLRKAKEAEVLVAIEQRKAEEARIARERELAREKLYDRHPTRKWTYVGAGLGAATLVTGGVFALMSRSAHSSFTDAGCGDRDQLLTTSEIAACRADADRGERYARLGNVLLAAGGAVFAASAIVFFLDPGNVERPEQAATRLTISPGSIQFVTRW